MDGYTCVAIIPARGGSKGIPRKNLQRIGVETLIARAVRVCSNAAYVSRVVVTSEDDAILAEAVRAGATPIMRPASLATDQAKSGDVLRHACAELDEFDIVAFCQCTAPLMTSVEIDSTIARLVRTDADVAVAATHTDAIQLTEGYHGRVTGIGWDVIRGAQRRQDRPSCYEIAGSVWALWRDRFEARETLYTNNTVLCRIAGRRLEIDTPEDLEYARQLLAAK